MARMELEKKKCITPEFRVSFPQVFEPKAFGDKAPEYSIVMLFDKSIKLGKAAPGSAISMVAAVRNACIEMWGENDQKWPTNLKRPWRDGSEKADVDGYENCIFVTAKSKMQPGLVDQKLRDIINPEEFYAGCYARAELIAFPYDQQGNKGVAFSLQHIQKLRDGEAFSGRRPASDVFEAVETDDDGDTDDDSDLGL